MWCYERKHWFLITTDPITLNMNTYPFQWHDIKDYMLCPPGGQWEEGHLQVREAP